MIRRPLSALALGALLACAGAHAANESVHADTPAQQRNPREHYTKYEYQVPMRDGVKLFTVVYVPKDSSKSYPFLMQRTPYSAGTRADGETRYGVDWFPRALSPTPELEQSGYIFVTPLHVGRQLAGDDAAREA
jgi:uncharacterized protein